MGTGSPATRPSPLDLRIDHVYLVSCKYLSKVLQNASPARLAEGLLTFRRLDDRRDWYERVAPVEYQALYRASLDALGATGFPASVTDLEVADRERLSPLLDGRTWPDGTQEAYGEFCRAVSTETARIWKASLRRSETGGHAVAAAADRVGAVLRARERRSGLHAASGSTPRGTGVRTTPWRASRSRPRSSASPGSAGRPAVSTPPRGRREVRGHIEIRWSHGRFRQRPEAKVYLDTPHAEVPGYNPL